MTYASDTKVPVERSRAELERTLKRYGADAFGYGQDGYRAVVSFRVARRTVRFEVTVPSPQSAEARRNRTETQAQRWAEQRERALWRALVLVVKAKLESVESGIETMEQAFMAHIVLPDGQTVGEYLAPQVEIAYERGSMPSLLPGVAQLPERT